MKSLLKHRHMVLIWVLFSAVSYGETSWCGRLFQGLREFAVGEAGGGLTTGNWLEAVISPQDFNPEFTAFHRAKSLETIEKLERENLSFKRPGESLEHLGESYPVIALLGAGSEGIVYRVRSPEGDKVIKQFFAPYGMEINLQAIETHSKTAPYVDVLSTDMDKRTAELDPTPAINVRSLLEGEFSLTPSQRRAIEKKYLDFRRRYPREMTAPQNVVLFPATGKFKFVDPF